MLILKIPVSYLELLSLKNIDTDVTMFLKSGGLYDSNNAIRSHFISIITLLISRRLGLRAILLLQCANKGDVQYA